MGAGASLPASEEAARAAGYSEAEIAAHSSQRRSRSEETAGSAGPPGWAEGREARASGCGEEAEVATMSVLSMQRKRDRPASENPYSAANRELAQNADKLRGYPWSKYVETALVPEFGVVRIDKEAPNFGLSSGLDRVTVCWDLELHDMRYTRSGKTGLKFSSAEILALDVTDSPASGKPLVVSAGWDGAEVKLWDLDGGTCVQVYRGFHAEKITCVKFLPSRALGYGPGGAGGAPPPPSPSPSFVPPADSGIYNLLAGEKANPPPGALLTASADGYVAVWSLSSGAPVCYFEAHKASSGGVSCLGLGDDGRLVATGGGKDRTVRCWDLETCAAVSPGGGGGGGGGGEGEDRTRAGVECGGARAPLPPTRSAGFEGHAGAVTGVCVVEDGRRVLSSSNDGTLKLWDLVSGQCVRTLKGHRGWVLCCAATSDGARCVSGSDDKTVKVWDVGSGKAVGSFSGHTHWVSAVDIDDRGKTVLSGDHAGIVKLWDLPLPGDAKQQASGVSLTGGHRSAVNAVKLFRWPPGASRQTL